MIVRARQGFRRKITQTGISLKEFALRAGISYAALRYIGPRDPHLATAWKIANALAELANVTPDQAFDSLFDTDENYSPLPAAA